MIKLKTILKFFRPSILWSILLYEVDENFTFQKKLTSPIKVFNYKNIWNVSKHIHSCADPFLFTYQDELYLFFESMSSYYKNAHIKAYKTKDLKTFIPLGIILKPPFHLSYPFVFTSNSSVYMIPESVFANEVALYKFAKFPNELVKSKVLLQGSYYDSSFIEHNGLWFLFTTSNNSLEIFYTKDIENEPLTPHPANPITTNPKYCRCGGSPIINNNSIYRITQDSSAEYGKNISLFKINKLTETEYDEELYIDDYFNNQEKWNSVGGHHLNCADFNGKKVIVVDGKKSDYFLSNFITIYFIIYKKLQQIFCKK
jgi:hypothetical protein